jgi:putative ABC transport system substrate-binding protein
MMDRRAFVVGTVALLAAPLAAEAQEAERVRRIGYLSPHARFVPATNPYLKAFVERLREHGWVVGQNLAIEYRFAEGQLDRLPALATELAELNVEVIVTSAGNAPIAVKNATTTIPIVAVDVFDPVGSGLVASLARPGGNLTVVTHHPELHVKGLEFLKQAAPRASRVAVLGVPASPLYASLWKNLDAVAPALGVSLQRVDVRTADEMDTAFLGMMRARPEVLYVMPTPLTWVERRRISSLALANRLPSYCSFKEFAEAGGLIGYAPDRVDMWRRGATYVDKILRGARVGDLPVEMASQLQLVLNLKTAKTLGLTIPPAVLARADEVIQ